MPRTPRWPLALLSACAASEPAPTEATPYEGDVAGECADGADNDRDGYFDCEDNGCWNAPDCEGAGGDGGDGADGGDGGDRSDGADGGDGGGGADGGDGADGSDGPAEAAHLRSFTLTYTLTWDFDDAYADLLAFYQLADCESTYQASGDAVSAEGLRATFQGPWALSETTCDASLVDAVWTEDTGESYASFTFGEGLSTLESWVQHREPDGWEPAADPSARGQWYITEMGAEMSGPTVTHGETDATTIEGIIPLDLVHHVAVTFSE